MRIRLMRSDSQGTIWIVFSKHPKDILAFYDTDHWDVVDIPLDEIFICDVDTYKGKLILGTADGIYNINFSE